MTSIAKTHSARQVGVDILITGLTLQAASLASFIALCVEYGLRVRKHAKAERNPAFDELRGRTRFICFEWGTYSCPAAIVLGDPANNNPAISFAALFIFIRCIYRVIELAQGFDGAIANAEVPFLILEGPMIMVAVLLMTVFHPGVVFRGGNWSQANWAFRPKNEKRTPARALDSEEKEMAHS